MILGAGKTKSSTSRRTVSRTFTRVLAPLDRRLAFGLMLIAFAFGAIVRVGPPVDARGEATWLTTRALVGFEGTAIDSSRVPLHPGARDPLVHAPDGTAHMTGGLFGALLGMPLDIGARLVSSVSPDRSPQPEADEEALSRRMVGWRDPILMAIGVALFSLVASRLGARRPAVVFGALTLFLASPFGAAARGWRTEWISGVLLLFAFHEVLSLRARLERRRPLSRGRLALMGTALGCATLSTRFAVPPSLVLLAAAEVVLRAGLAAPRRTGQPAPPGGRRAAIRAWAWVALPYALGLAVVCVTNALRFGHPLDAGLDTGLQVHNPDGWWRAALYRVAAVLGSPGDGVLLSVPALLLLPWAWSEVRNRGERLWPAVSLWAIVAFLLSAVMFEEHAYGPGASAFLPVLPLCWLAVPLVVKRARSSVPIAWALGATLVLGVFAQLPHFLVHHETHQELSAQAIALERPEASPQPADVRLRATWDPRFAQPWAQWRILRHRVAGLGEEFPAEIIFLDSATGMISPTAARLCGFQHLALVAAEKRRSGRGWVEFLAACALGAVGAILCMRALLGAE